MTEEPQVGNYVLVSPVKDEEKYLESTLRAVIGQSLRPYRWVIVDDSSTDRTADILADYASRFPWIQVLRLNHKEERQPGSPVIRAFWQGYRLVEHDSFDYIVKFDCDLDLPQDYFEQLVEKFVQESDLGIASGVYLEEAKGGWAPVSMPSYHAAGACKMVRAACFRQIGGFIESRGWDTVDEIRAQTKGWKTRHFEHIQFHHLKKEGSAIGSLATNRMHGEVYYRTGGARLFFIVKVLHRMFAEKPRVSGGAALLWGYVRSWLANDKLLVNTEEARFYSLLLNSRIWRRFRNFTLPAVRQRRGVRGQ